MNPRLIAFYCTILILSGCSSRDWGAKFHIVKAEGAVRKAQDMKERKVPFEERMPQYKEACGHYINAYEMDPAIFTLIRIEEAADACWKAGDRNEEQIFRMFEEEYAKAHPQETEYGDAGVGMIDMGG